MNSIKKLAVLIPFYPPENSGILNTLKDKVDAWSLHFDVQVYFLNKGHEKKWADLDDRFEVITGRNHLTAFTKFSTTVRDYGPDLLYARYSFPFPGFTKLAKEIPTVLEIHSAELIEYRTHRRHLLPACMIGRWPLLRQAAGHVYINHITALHWTNQIFKRPSKVIPNGITFRATEFAQDRLGSEKLTIVMTIGSDNIWQGTDKFIAMAQAFPEHRFVLVGDVSNSSDIPENLVRQGPVSRQSLMQLFSNCHVGVGTLALHRSGRNEASALKVREYLAGGLAVILAYEDTDVGVNSLPQVLTLPNTEDCVESSIETIRAFLNNLSSAAIEFESVEFLSSTHKEAERVAFMERCLERTTDSAVSDDGI